MPVVSNTSPIWNLASIGRLNLLRQQHPEVLIPPDVLDELQLESGLPETLEIQQALDEKWIQVKTLGISHLKESLMLELDRGEAAAIALALEREITRIIIDETDGRTIARTLGVNPIGVLGILLRAKQDGSIISVYEEMRKLRQEAGFYIAESLFQRVLLEAGE